jgi:hypothetical protein
MLLRKKARKHVGPPEPLGFGHIAGCSNEGPEPLIGYGVLINSKGGYSNPADRKLSIRGQDLFIRAHLEDPSIKTDKA